MSSPRSSPGLGSGRAAPAVSIISTIIALGRLRRFDVLLHELRRRIRFDLTYIGGELDLANFTRSAPVGRDLAIRPIEDAACRYFTDFLEPEAGCPRGYLADQRSAASGRGHVALLRGGAGRWRSPATWGTSFGARTSHRWRSSSPAACRRSRRAMRCSNTRTRLRSAGAEASPSSRWLRSRKPKACGALFIFAPADNSQAPAALRVGGLRALPRAHRELPVLPLSHDVHAASRRIDVSGPSAAAQAQGLDAR
jgi:hypothetical protein